MGGGEPRMSNDVVNDDWWPDVLKSIPRENPIAGEYALVAAIDQPWGSRSYRHLYTALAPTDLIDTLILHPGGIDHEVRATGPFPAMSPTIDETPYRPRFFIGTAGIVPEGLEPLCVAWTSTNKTYVVPDQGFLMTYGLIPRYIETEGAREIHWDDPSIPRESVVKAKPISEYHFPRHSRAFVLVRTDYLQDYATLRGLHMLQVYFAENWDDPPSDIQEALEGKESREFTLPGRLIRIYGQSSPRSYLASAWGTRPLMGPDTSPVTEGRWEYGELSWPGIEGAVTQERAMSSTLLHAFVTDRVLGRYEGKEEFTVHPESGGVSYGGQWSTGNTSRIGRDVIRVELKKLYEGTPPEVVQHFHRHSVPKPPGDSVELREQANIATRTRRIVYALVSLGELIASEASEILEKATTSLDTVKLSRADLDYEGWWMNGVAERAARHAPLNMAQDEFLSRCGELDKLVVEGMNEKILREMLVNLNVDPELISSWRSLKLLSYLLQMISTASEAGLRIPEDSREVADRTAERETTHTLPTLLHLRELRTAGSHRGGKSHDARIVGALSELQMDPQSTSSGWGNVLDKLYDEVASELEMAAEVLREHRSTR